MPINLMWPLDLGFSGHSIAGNLLFRAMVCTTTLRKNINDVENTFVDGNITWAH